MTRPDIIFAVSNVSKFCSNPNKQHWTAVKRIMRYLKGTQNVGLLYKKVDSSVCVGLILTGLEITRIAGLPKAIFQFGGSY